MFTGLIEEVGTVLTREKINAGTRLRLRAPRLGPEVHLGDSIAVNGCCLTVVGVDSWALAFDLLEETLRCTNLPQLQEGDYVNLERALTADGRLGGHFVQGHVDCAAPIVALREEGADLRLEIQLPAESARYVVPKGSIAVNGISLTIADVSETSFAVWVIPHTKSQTNLATVKRDDAVNLEFDLLAKYVERMLDREIPPA
jgi:riboflavin synthase